MGFKNNSNEKNEKLFLNLKGSEIPIDRVSIAVAISSFTTFFIIILKVKGLFEYSGLIFLGEALLIYFLLTLLEKRTNKSSSNKVVFVGTRNELVEYLRKNNFWKNEDEYRRFTESTFYNVKELGNVFEEFTIDFEKMVISESAGFIYTLDNKPSYPQKINICLNAEGFSQYEINKAISALSHEMDKQRADKTEGIKDFYITKD
ncbi:hypothetical protein [Vagococcus fluvialis]|uniref:Uncharacterized protein n=1 Tax=Vagococcus fluvialis TaxID=2738 RepID=A0A7X6DB06_9ENTE|nr:hypothetical protein [Vagococcus fluvialis]NKC69067.1 hypothetical protein [Vagococcus fluvialis]